MDQLEVWGKLARPEEVGVVPRHVSPSMLVPKPDDAENFRLVTDFTSLNIWIKKLETTLPTIAEAKLVMAQFTYMIEFDLTSWYFQSGMPLSSIQYLGTVHPRGGLRVYTCEPQGIKNAAEHGKEKLARIYQDMIRRKELTIMADNGFIGASTLPELTENYREVLNRVTLAGLTFKPSKIVICAASSMIFGWKRTCEGAWSPTEHTTSPLIYADPPKTVKQMRSYLGATLGMH